MKNTRGNVSNVYNNLVFIFNKKSYSYLVTTLIVLTYLTSMKYQLSLHTSVDFLKLKL